MYYIYSYFLCFMLFCLLSVVVFVVCIVFVDSNIVVCARVRLLQKLPSLMVVLYFTSHINREIDFHFSSDDITHWIEEAMDENCIKVYNTHMKQPTNNSMSSEKYTNGTSLSKMIPFTSECVYCTWHSQRKREQQLTTTNNN